MMNTILCSEQFFSAYDEITLLMVDGKDYPVSVLTEESAQR